MLSKEEKFEIQDIIKILNEDFLENYKEKEPSKNEIIHSKVKEYFNENRIEDLMDYGNDGDEGLYKLSSLYEEIMDKLNIKYDYVYTDVSDGKYLTTIIFNNNEKISIDTSARNGKEVVTSNVKFIYEFYKKLKKQERENVKETELEYGENI